MPRESETGGEPPVSACASPHRRADGAQDAVDPSAQVAQAPRCDYRDQSNDEDVLDETLAGPAARPGDASHESVAGCDCSATPKAQPRSG